MIYYFKFPSQAESLYGDWHMISQYNINTVDVKKKKTKSLACQRFSKKRRLDEREREREWPDFSILITHGLARPIQLIQKKKCKEVVSVEKKNGFDWRSSHQKKNKKQRRRPHFYKESWDQELPAGMCTYPSECYISTEVSSHPNKRRKMISVYIYISLWFLCWYQRDLMTTTKKKKEKKGVFTYIRLYEYKLQ